MEVKYTKSGSSHYSTSVSSYVINSIDVELGSLIVAVVGGLDAVVRVR